MCAPRCFGVQEIEDQNWLWLEYVQDESQPQWQRADFEFAAKQLGSFAAQVVTIDLPIEPWLYRDSHHSLTSPNPCFDLAHIRHHFSNRTRERVNQLWEELNWFKAVRQKLPHAHCHGDVSRRNLMIRHRSMHGQAQLIAIDWAKYGIQPVGADLYSLLGTSCFLNEWDIEAIKEIEENVLVAYLSGLDEGGWQVDSANIRLAYLSLSATVFALLAPMAMSGIDPETEKGQMNARRIAGCDAETFNAKTARLCEYGLDCADQARQLMHKLS